MHMSHPFPTDPRSVMVDYSQQEMFKSSELWVALCLHAAEGGTGSLAALPSSHPPTSKPLHTQVFPRAHNGSFQGVFRFKKLYFLFSVSFPSHSWVLTSFVTSSHFPGKLLDEKEGGALWR